MKSGNEIIDVRSWAAGEAADVDGGTGAGSASAAPGARDAGYSGPSGSGHGAKAAGGAAHSAMWKKVGAGVLAAVLVGGCVPLTAFAAQYHAGQNATVASSSADFGQSGGQSGQQSGDGQDSQQPGGDGQAGGQAPSGDTDGQPPEKPDGDTSGPQDGQAQGQGGQPPAMPDGGSQQGGGPGGQGGDGQQGGQGGQMPGGGGANTQSFDYTGSYSGALTADGSEKSSTGETVESAIADQNAALVQNGGSLSISGDTVSKSGDSTSSQDNVNFYGTNAGILAVGEGSAAYVDGTDLTTDAAGANGIFATDKATVYANDVRITTKSAQGNSRGLDATYGGTIVGNKLAISTAGNHCASIATDRGGGSVSVAGSTLATAGSGSPLLYSTGDIEADGVSGTASGSQIAGMEGKNSIYIEDSQLSSTNNAISGSDPVKNGVIIYQSTSGDADTSTGDAARFEVLRSTLATTIDSGSMFYFTNTNANVVVSESTLDFDSSKVNLVQAQGNDANNWGSAGSNGATVNFTLKKQEAAGNVTADDISSATVYLLDGSTWSGAASITENAAANKKTSEAPLTVNVGSDSTWVVTADSTVANLNVQDGGRLVDGEGKSVSIVAGGSTVVYGEGDTTITVTGAYGTSFETGDANEIQGASIDRSAFDARYGTGTQFGVVSQTGSSSAANADTGASADGGRQNFFEWVREFVERLFGGGQDSSQRQSSQASQGGSQNSQNSQGGAQQQGGASPQQA